MTVQRLAAQLAATDKGALPTGDHVMRLSEVRIVNRSKGGFALRIISENGARATAREMRNLARQGEDPFNLTAGQRKGLVEFAQRFNIHETDPKTICEQLIAATGSEVNVTVRQTPHSTVCKHSAPQGIRLRTDAGVLTVAGEVVTPDDAHRQYERLIEGLRGTRLAMTYVAQACWEIRRDSSWEALGYRTLAEFLADPQVSISKSSFFRFCSIWQTYHLDGGVEPEQLSAAGPQKLAIPLRALAAGEVEVEEVMDDVEALGIKDLKAKYADKREEEGESPTVGPKGCPRCEGIPDEVLDELRQKWSQVA